MSPDVTVIAVPSSAGAFSPGQERAPGALRRARLAERLGEHGAAVHDWIELEGFTWRPDRDRPRAQHVEAVRRVATRTAEAVAAQLRAGRRVVVLGGDCTVGIGTVAGAVSATGDAGLVYLDRHADLNTPDSVAAGTLDWMGMSHMLDAPGALPELAGAFAARPLLAAERVVVLGGDESAWSAGERRQAERLGLARVGQEALVGAPEEAAERALAHLGAACERFLVHFDVDVLDFVDAPYAEETNGRNRGPTLEQATRALGGLWRDPRCLGMTLTELNPMHAETADPDLARMAGALAGALAIAA